MRHLDGRVFQKHRDEVTKSQVPHNSRAVPPSSPEPRSSQCPGQRQPSKAEPSLDNHLGVFPVHVGSSPGSSSHSTNPDRSVGVPQKKNTTADTEHGRPHPISRMAPLPVKSPAVKEGLAQGLTGQCFPFPFQTPGARVQIPGSGPNFKHCSFTGKAKALRLFVRNG